MKITITPEMWRQARSDVDGGKPIESHCVIGKVLRDAGCSNIIVGVILVGCNGPDGKRQLGTMSDTAIDLVDRFTKFKDAPDSPIELELLKGGWI